MPGTLPPIFRSIGADYNRSVFIVHNIPAQGNSTPSRIFINHSFNEYGGRFYDPSYHISEVSNYHIYENRAFAAYCNQKKVRDEEEWKKMMFGNLVNFCWEQYEQSINGNTNALGECLSDENSQCATNDLQLCEIMECSDGQ